jgi:hypothetical protein
MSDFFATVIAEAVVLLIEALITRLIRALFGSPTPASAPVAYAT